MDEWDPEKNALCRGCINREVCYANHWVMTFDKDGKTCDNYEPNQGIRLV